MILVTGGTGFIGSHLIERLVAHGEPVRALVRKTGLFENSPVQAFHADLATNDRLATALEGVDTVIHLAGATKPLTIAGYYSGNVTASENLARAVAGAGRPIRFIHVSSLSAAGPGSDATPVTEDAPAQPVSHYGKSKLQGEIAVRSILPDAVIVRPPAVYGPRDTDVFEILKSINKGLVSQIAGGERWFSTIYVDDLVSGILAARQPQAAGRTYYLAERAATPWSDLVGISARIMGRQVRALTLPFPVAYAVGYGGELWSRITRKPGIVSRDKVSEMRCGYWLCDPERARNELGFQATTTIQEGLERTLAWYRAAGWLTWK